MEHETVRGEVLFFVRLRLPAGRTQDPSRALGAIVCGAVCRELNEDGEQGGDGRAVVI